jgi:hypothetical protein
MAYSDSLHVLNNRLGTEGIQQPELRQLVRLATGPRLRLGLNVYCRFNWSGSDATGGLCNIPRLPQCLESLIMHPSKELDSKIQDLARLKFIELWILILNASHHSLASWPAEISPSTSGYVVAR